MSLTFGSSLRRLRKRKRLTLQQVADAMGVKYPAVQQWEADKTVPSYDKIQNLSNTLGADISGMYKRPGTSFDVDYTEELLQACIDIYEEDQKLQAEGAILNRDPQMYAIHMRSRNLEESSIAWHFDLNKTPSLHRYLRILETEISFDQERFKIIDRQVGYAEKPDSLKIMKTPFGFYMPNASMSPRYELGELLIFDDVPSNTHVGYSLICNYAQGDSTALDCLVAKIVSQTEEVIIAFVLNPIQYIQIRRTNQTAVHRAIELKDIVQVFSRRDKTT